MTKMVLAYYVVFAAFALVAMVNAVNDRPIIGMWVLLATYVYYVKEFVVRNLT